MPMYDYRCTNVACGFEFEFQTTVQERDLPCVATCPHCEKEEAFERFLAGAPGFADPMRLGRKRAPDAFNDLLKNMKPKFRGNQIATR